MHSDCIITECIFYVQPITYITDNNTSINDSRIKDCQQNVYMLSLRHKHSELV